MYELVFPKPHKFFIHQRQMYAVHVLAISDYTSEILVQHCTTNESGTHTDCPDIGGCIMLYVELNTNF